jgi:hypothetical protein
VSSWFEGNGNGKRIDVVKLLDSDAGRLAHEVVGAGALVSLGLTSDGGALGVTITVDGTWRRDYFREEESLQAWLAEALPAVAELRGQTSPTSVAAPRSRRPRTR